MAQQDAEKARFLVEKAEQVKKAAVITAEGDSKAAELIAKALTEAGEGVSAILLKILWLTRNLFSKKKNNIYIFKLLRFN